MTMQHIGTLRTAQECVCVRGVCTGWTKRGLISESIVVL